MSGSCVVIRYHLMTTKSGVSFRRRQTSRVRSFWLTGTPGIFANAGKKFRTRSVSFAFKGGYPGLCGFYQAPWQNSNATILSPPAAISSPEEEADREARRSLNEALSL